jgi:hypothetical protein
MEVLGRVAIVLIACGLTQPAPLPTVSFEMRCDAAPFDHGDAINCELAVANNGARPLLISHRLRTGSNSPRSLRDVYFDVVDADTGQRARSSWTHCATYEPDDTYGPLASGAELTRDVYLRHELPDRSGRYRVTAVLDLTFDPDVPASFGAWHGTIRASPVLIEIRAQTRTRESSAR